MTNPTQSSSGIVFEQVQRIMHEKAVFDEQTIRYVFKPAPRFIPERWWFKLIGRLFVREVHRNV